MNDKSVTDPQEQARILSEALPHMQRYDEENIVIKYGGHAMGNALDCRHPSRRRFAPPQDDVGDGGAFEWEAAAGMTVERPVNAC